MRHVTVTAHLKNVGRLPREVVMRTEMIVNTTEERRGVILETIVLEGTVMEMAEMMGIEGADPLPILQHGAIRNTARLQMKETAVLFTTAWTESRMDTPLGRSLARVPQGWFRVQAQMMMSPSLNACLRHLRPKGLFGGNCVTSAINGGWTVRSALAQQCHLNNLLFLPFLIL
jgi:hypothetical protein